MKFLYRPHIFRKGVSDQVETHELGQYADPPDQLRYDRYNSQHGQSKNNTASGTVQVEAIHPLPDGRPRKRGIARLLGFTRRLILYVAATAIILLFNIIWLIVARVKYGLNGEAGTVSRGSCGQSTTLNSNLHLVINILSTIILVASTTFMVIAYSPSRSEINVAHKQRRCLSVGSLGFRNLKSISWKKKIIYLVLMLTSSPFHLLANSAVFLTLAGNGYTWALVNEQFVLDTNHTQPITVSPELRVEKESILQELQASALTLDKLTNDECVKAYSDVYQSTRRSLLIVTPTIPDKVSGAKSSSVFVLDNSFAGKYANSWICGRTQANASAFRSWQERQYEEKCDISGGRIPKFLGINTWADMEIFDKPVAYCLSEKVEPMCSVQYSPLIVSLLILCMLLKLTGMIIILRDTNRENRPLSCPGDAVASFLEQQDPTTDNMCLATRKGVRKLWKDPKPKPYKTRIRRSWRAASRHRWTFFFLSVAAIFFGLFVLMIGAVDKAKSGSSKYRFFSNFGKVNTDLLDLGGGTKQASIMEITAGANLPQFILAIMWLLYRDIFISMAYAHDWAMYEHGPQRLMVSAPRGEQRGIWFLGHPWKGATILLLFQILVHFLLSQSIFAVRIEAYDQNGDPDPTHLVSNIGYSPVAMLVSMLVCVFLVVVLFNSGRMHMPSSSPIVGTCTAAISAACHPTREMHGMANEYLRWGEVRTYEGEQRHCSMTAALDFDQGLASPPEDGVLYAGRR